MGKESVNICWLPPGRLAWYYDLHVTDEQNLVLQRLESEQNLFYRDLSQWLKFPLNSRAKHKTLETKSLSDQEPLFLLVFMNSYGFSDELFFTSSDLDELLKTYEPVSPGKLCYMWWWVPGLPHRIQLNTYSQEGCLPSNPEPLRS